MRVADHLRDGFEAWAGRHVAGLVRLALLVLVVGLVAGAALPQPVPAHRLGTVTERGSRR